MAKIAIYYIQKSYRQFQLQKSPFVQMIKHNPGKFPTCLDFVCKLIYQLAYRWVQTCFYWSKWEFCHWLWWEQVHAPNEVCNGNGVHTKNLDTASMRNTEWEEGFLRIPEHVNSVLQWHLSIDKKSEEIKWKNRIDKKILSHWNNSPHAWKSLWKPWIERERASW